MSLRNKLAIVGLSGVMFTGAAVGLSGIASAEGPEVKADDSTAPAVVDEAEGAAFAVDGDEAVMLEEYEISAEDEAIFETYDQCLTDNGVDHSAFDAGMDIDGDAAVAVEVFEIDENMEAAFEACDSILEGLSEELTMIDELDGVECWVGEAEIGDLSDFELSPEEEAMFEQLEEGEAFAFSAIIGDDGELEILEDSELAEGDWIEAEEFDGDHGVTVEHFELSPDDEIFLDGLELEGCGDAIMLSVDGDDFDSLDLEELTEGEVEAASADA